MRSNIPPIAMTAASVALQLSILAGQLNRFTWLAPYLWGISLGLWLAWILGRRTRPERLSESNKTSQPSAPPNVNVSPTISADISPTISPTFNLGVSMQSDKRPKLTFLEWKIRPHTMDRWDAGFVLENHGEAALDVKVQRFEVAQGIFADTALVPTIGERQSELVLVWIEGLPRPDMQKWDLPGAMKRAAEAKDRGVMYRVNYSVPIVVTYRDFENQAWLSTAELSYIPSRGELSFGPTTQRRIP
jgi:hypothetical protein